MGYANVALFRTYTGLSSSDVADAAITALIPEADKWTIQQISTRVYDETLRGNIDNSNTLYTTKYKPIADINYDKVIDDSDVTAYLVHKDSENNPLSTETAVISVNSRDGIITLTTAPTTDNAAFGVHADYSYYSKNIEPDWNRVVQAACYYLGHLVLQKIYGHVPYTFKAGHISMNIKSPGQTLKDAALHILNSESGPMFVRTKPTVSGRWKT